MRGVCLGVTEGYEACGEKKDIFGMSNVKYLISLPRSHR